MGWQLIYTSSPRCLKAGHSGFGTVARHRELRARLVEILERFSSYERPSSDPTPRIDSHRIIDLSDERYHVVTRIRDAGTDYSGRTNHIAHHVIFSADEVAAADATPIDFLISWNGWRTAWTEPARFLDDQAPVALGDIPHSFPPPSRAWAKLTGDPGSAACLSPHRETLIIAKPGCEDALLPLMGESLALIDHESWAIPFTTFLKSNDNPDDFLWRACPRGAAAESAARRRRATIIDPGDPPSLPRPDPDLVDRARWGRPTATRPATPRVPAPERPDLPGASAARPGHATPRRPIPALLPEPDFADANCANGSRDRKSAMWLALMPVAALALISVAAFALFRSDLARSWRPPSKPPSPAPPPSFTPPPTPTPQGPAPPTPSPASPTPTPAHAPAATPGTPATPAKPIAETIPHAIFSIENLGRCPAHITLQPFHDIVLDSPSLAALARAFATGANGLRIVIAADQAETTVLRQIATEDRLRCYLGDVPCLSIALEGAAQNPRFIIRPAPDSPAFSISRLAIFSAPTPDTPLLYLVFARPGYPLLGTLPTSALRLDSKRLTLTHPDIATRLRNLRGAAPISLRCGRVDAPLSADEDPSNLAFDVSAWNPLDLYEGIGGPQTQPKSENATSSATLDDRAASVLETINAIRAISDSRPALPHDIASEDQFFAIVGSTIRGGAKYFERQSSGYLLARRDLDRATSLPPGEAGWLALATLDARDLVVDSQKKVHALQQKAIDSLREKQRKFVGEVTVLKERARAYRSRLSAVAGHALSPPDVPLRLEHIKRPRIECAPFGAPDPDARITLIQFE